MASNLADADVIVVVEYQAGATSYSGRTDAEGQATVEFPSSTATPAYIVPVKVTVGGQAKCETKFVVPRTAT